MRLTLTLLLLLACTTALAEVRSETVFFIKPDGIHFLLERSIQSDSPTQQLHLHKDIDLQDIRHISPGHFDWNDQGNPQANLLNFNSGSFTVIYPGRFNPSELTRNNQGNYQYRSWNGKRDRNGHYGYWYAPGNFDAFTYTWILPDNAELLGYHSNRPGNWTRRGNAVSYYGEDVNNLTFEISYRIPKPPQNKTGTNACQPSNTETKVAAPTKPPATTAKAPAVSARGGFGSISHKPDDSDHDGVPDRRDLCPHTPHGAHVDQVGCPFDTDRDGVPDGIDKCIATPEGTPVDAQGCALKKP